MPFHDVWIHSVGIMTKNELQTHDNLTICLIKAGATFDFASLTNPTSDTALDAALAGAEAGFKGYARQIVPTSVLIENFDTVIPSGQVSFDLDFAYNSLSSGTDSETIDRILVMINLGSSLPGTAFIPMYLMEMTETITFAADGNVLNREFRLLDFNAPIPT